ncbi:IgGFc-binding protein [Mizuhopecten yessoensis]|uniref:IgGFc-binding protein n=1 Tax=Mizuhopecten yessoensis TaxID=6573 RepID=A0A210QAB8_MIZYE|nr:IgGFc-binding protein [Mizuhopecten yessoensis]
MLGFPENRVQGYSYLRVTVTNACERRINVTITSHVFNDLDTYVLQPAASDTSTVAGELMVKGSKRTKQGVKIITTGDAKVYIEVDNINAKEGALVIPVQFLGYRHYVVTGVSTEGTTQSEILLVGVTDQTDVAVTIHTTTNVIYDRDMFFNGAVIYIQLDEFDTVQIQSDSGDLSGSLIESSSPISVFSGNQAVSINTNVGYLLEQMPAIMFWQTKFVIVPPKGFNYECKIVAAFSWTLVRYRCSLVGWHDVLLVSAGTDVALQLGSALCTVIASKPILTTMIIRAMTFDPAMVVIQPVREVHRHIPFYVPETLEFAQIILVTYTDDIYDMTLDNDTLTNVIAPSFEPLYVAVVEDIKSGTHIIKTSGSSLRISGYIFGLFGGLTSAFPLQFQQNRVRIA